MYPYCLAICPTIRKDLRLQGPISLHAVARYIMGPTIAAHKLPFHVGCDR
jgi:succinate dehydrogenase/fumarate reductase-like Fe-S protein